jgi:hypothetical protein
LRRSSPPRFGPPKAIYSPPASIAHGRPGKIKGSYVFPFGPERRKMNLL